MSRDALVVGINQYQHLPSLTAAAKDAEGIANTLETHSDFRVRRLPEIVEGQRPKVGQQTLVSTQQLETSLVRLLLPKGEHIPEAVFFYFSGHGIQREIGIREGYLAVSDTQPNASGSGLSLSWLRRLIKHSPVRQILIILDCCHSGEFLSLKDDGWQGRDGQSYLFIAASREYEEAYESLSSHYSVLTQAIISNLLPEQSEKGRITSTDLVAAITNQLSHEIQQPLFEQGGSEIVITRQQTERVRPKSENISIISRLKQYSFNFCPYRGPQPFEERHKDYYFGREVLIQDFLKNLQQANICTLLGASGSGKTSLLRAGIIPRLASGQDILGSENWLVRYITPGARPLKSLATAFAINNQNITIAQQLLQTENLLKQQVDGLVHLVSAAMLQQPGIRKIWLIVDQFEELLGKSSDPQIQQERTQMINVLTTALRCPQIPLGVILSLRSDTIDELCLQDELFPLVKNNRIVMTPMSYQEIRDVIEKPAEKLGLQIEPHLIHNLTLDLTGAPGELALLQNTLYELWRNRTATYQQVRPSLSLESYIRLGRLSTMLIHRATAVYQTLPAEEQAAAKRIFLSLCDPGEGRADRCRRARKSELVNQQFSKALIERVLNKLVAARLIVLDTLERPPQTLGQPAESPVVATAWNTQASCTANVKRWFITSLATSVDPSVDTINFAHKSLLLEWSILREWVQHYRPILRHRWDLEERAHIWCERGEPNHTEYLLGQQYLKESQRFLQTHGQDLSSRAQRFVGVSQRTILFQRWQTRSIAVMLPIAMMAGMTVSLVRHQITAYIKSVSSRTPPRTILVKPQKHSVPEQNVRPILPQRFGKQGFERLTITSQILSFHRRYPASELSQISIAQLVNLMSSSSIMQPSTALPDTLTNPVKGREHPYPLETGLQGFNNLRQSRSAKATGDNNHGPSNQPYNQAIY